LESGDQLVMVNFSAVENTTLRQLLQGTVGNEVAVTVLRGEAEITSLLTPISWREERQLRYEAWRRATAEFVEQATDGRVGYIHIQGMNQPSLEVFERDLYAACAGKDALLLDVRNNGGGWTKTGYWLPSWPRCTLGPHLGVRIHPRLGTILRIDCSSNEPPCPSICCAMKRATQTRKS